MNLNLRSLALASLLAIATSSPLSRPLTLDDVLDRALLKAVEQHDQEKVLELLKQGANINAKGINLTVLQTAIFQADVDIVKLLLEKGAKINDRDLADASRGVQGDNQKSTAIVKLLIARGADIRTNGVNALIEAAESNNIELVNLFLAKGVNPNGKTKEGKSVLFEVIPKDAVAAVEALLAAGADAKVIDPEYSQTLLMRAARADHRSDPAVRIRLLKLLLARGANIQAKDNDGKTVLLYAVQQYMSEAGGFLSHPEIVRMLLDEGADINARDKGGNTALMETVQVWHGSAEIPKLLVDKGADVNLANEEGQTALLLAAKEGRNDLVQLLLDKGAKLDAKDKGGNTALVYAVEAGQLATVGLLANKGFDLQASPYKTENALRVASHNFTLLKAVISHEVEEVKKFLEAGAVPYFRSRDGKVALLLAVGDSYGEEIVKLLLEKNADVNVTDDLGNTPLMFAASRNGDELVSLLLERKASVNMKNKKQETALHLAAQDGYARVMELLLANGADVRARDANGLTALLLASQAFNPQAEVVQLLLAKGAEANATDGRGNTPLMLAARGGEFQNIEPLVAGGVNVQAKNKDGWTALRHAKESKESWTRQQYAEQQRAEVIRLLEKAGAKE